MRKGVDIEIRDNTMEGIIEGLERNKNLIKSYSIYDLKIDEIKIDFDFDENRYYLKIRYEEENK